MREMARSPFAARWVPETGDVSPELVVNEAPLKTEPNKNSAKVWGVNGLIKQNGKDRDYAFGRTVSTPAVHDGFVYMTDMDSFFYCFDARTGIFYDETFLGTQAEPLKCDAIHLRIRFWILHVFVADEWDLERRVEAHPRVAPILGHRDSVRYRTLAHLRARMGDRPQLWESLTSTLDDACVGVYVSHIR